MSTVKIPLIRLVLTVIAQVCVKGTWMLVINGLARPPRRDQDLTSNIPNFERYPDPKLGLR